MADRTALTPERLMRRATFYLARQSASTQRLREVLGRAVRRHADPAAPPGDAEVAALVEPVIERLQRAGVLDDAAFARGRLARLAAKGKPARAIRAELAFGHGVDIEAAGVDEALAALDPLAQATRWAQRRRLGPFRLKDREAKRDADIGSLVRAGFGPSVAIRVVDAASPDDLAEDDEA